MERLMDGTVEAMYAIFEKAKRYDELAFMNRSKMIHCSFCGKSQAEVRKLVVGPGVNICDECVELCVEITDEKEHTNEETKERVCEQAGDVQTDRP